MACFDAAKIKYSAPLLNIAAERMRDNVTAGALGYAVTVAGVREAGQLETERCIHRTGAAAAVQQTYCSNAARANLLHRAQKKRCDYVIGRKSAKMRHWF